MKVLTPKGRAGFFECGRHSGFPDCCIAFFVDKYLPVFLVGEGAHLKPYLRRVKDAGYEGGFIPCPDCLEKKRPQVILSCDCEKEIRAAMPKKPPKLKRHCAACDKMDGHAAEKCPKRPVAKKFVEIKR